jgi:uncharacterized protein
MANVSYPGVYVEEVSSGVHPIAAASTSTAAFIGVAEQGNVAEAIKVYSFAEFQQRYGGFLPGQYLAHAVYQFFNNGGSQCYVVRVGGPGAAAANIVVNDLGAVAQPSLTITASSPGAWGNRLQVVVDSASNDPATTAGSNADYLAGNYFKLKVYLEGDGAPRETFDNLSMVPGSPTYVEDIVAASHYLSIRVNAASTNAGPGTSRGNGAPTVPLPPDRTRLSINVNGDGFQEIDLSSAVGGGAGQVADLATAAHVASAIAYCVTRLHNLRASTTLAPFTGFLCAVDSGALLLTSGARGATSSVVVAPALDRAHDASGLLKLGALQGGTEKQGAATTRPPKNTNAVPFYLVGDAAIAGAVVSVNPGSDGSGVVNDQSYIDALKLLDSKDDVSLLAIPGIGSPVVVGSAMNYCERRSLSDCFFIGDMGLVDDTPTEAQSFAAAVSPKNSYGAVYMPWLLMPDPTGMTAEPLKVPPSGFVAGVYAKTDGQRGVWKAPAGTTAGIGGASGLVVSLTDVEQGNLNPRNINVIRQFAAAGIVPWGARTLTADAEWNYVPVRRMAIFLRVSVYRGIQWAVFEPNDDELWSALRLNINAFMMSLYRNGAFQGSSPAQAFFVKCDSETTTQADIDNGIVNVLVGFAPLKPAEFVVVKISQKAGSTA